VIEPLKADRSTKTVISGHRRRAAAIKIGMSAVPVILVDCPNSDEQLNLLIESNRQREKNKEQLAREFKALTEVKELLAKQRKKQGRPKKTAKPAKTDTKKHAQKFPQDNSETRNATARDEAAKEVGMSRPTAEKAAAVVDEIDAAEEEGDQERADELRDSLNSGSVSAAHRQAQSTKTKPQTTSTELRDSLDRIVPDELRESHSRAAAIQALGRQLDGIKREAYKLAELPGGEHLDAQHVEIALKEVKGIITQARYWSECPRCQGEVNDDCRKCRGSGFLPFALKGQLSTDDELYLGISK